MAGFGGSGASFGGGFASGLAQVLSQKRNRDEVVKQRQIDNTWKSMQFLIDSGQVSDVADLQPHMDTLTNLGAFGDVKKQKKGQPAPQDHVVTMLGHVLGSNQGVQPPGASVQATPQPEVTGPDDAGQVQPNTSLPSQPLAIPQTGSQIPTHRTLGGIPLLSPDEAIQQKIGREGAATMARVRLAKDKIFPALQAVDKDATLDDALAYAFGQRPQSQLYGQRPQSVAGEIVGPDGSATPGFAVFQHGQYLDPDTGKPLENFRPRTTTGSMNLGADRESIARELYHKRAADLDPTEMADVNQKVMARAAEKAGGTTTARAEAASKAPLSTQARLGTTIDLQKEWTDLQKPVKETTRQLGIMETGLKRFKEGDKNGGSQAVLVTFQKILDPNSVVRESEYDRSPQGLGLKQRMEGYLERLRSGGAGVPAEELEGMVETARQFASQMNTYNELERDRITKTAGDAGINPDRVFGVVKAVEDKANKSAAPTAKKDKNGNWILQVP